MWVLFFAEILRALSIFCRGTADCAAVINFMSNDKVGEPARKVVCFGCRGCNSFWDLFACFFVTDEALSTNASQDEGSLGACRVRTPLPVRPQRGAM